jgi:hypothetical protein
MSDPMPFGAIFPGRKVEPSDWPANLLGALRVLQPADEDRLRLARRDLREIPEEELERLGPPGTSGTSPARSSRSRTASSTSPIPGPRAPRRSAFATATSSR